MSKGYLDNYTDLKELIITNPELPIMFMCSDECSNPDYSWSIGSAKAKIEYVLYEKCLSDEKIYTSEDDLQEDLELHYYEEHDELTELQQEEAVREEMKWYEDKWIKSIIVYVEAY